jgi:hypothetical protein
MKAIAAIAFLVAAACSADKSSSPSSPASPNPIRAGGGFKVIFPGQSQPKK